MAERVCATTGQTGNDARATAKTKRKRSNINNIIKYINNITTRDDGSESVGRRRLEERDAHLRLVVVGGQRRGRRIRRRPVVHFRVRIGSGQVDDDGRRARVGVVAAVHGHHGSGTAGRPATAAAAAAGHRRGRGRRSGRRGRRPGGRRLVARGRGRLHVAAVVVQRVAGLAAAGRCRRRRGRVTLLHLHLDQLLLVDGFANRVRRALSLVLLKHQYAIRPC